MKKLIMVLALGFSAATGFAQGTVAFSNNFPTAVINALTGHPVTGTNAFRAALYYAVDGVADESSFVPIGAPGSFFPSPPYAGGLFGSGVRTTPTNTPPGGYAMFQVRAWEMAYGSNYQLAVQAPAMNGRRALVGKSVIMRIKTGGAGASPSFLFGPNAVPPLQSFVVDIAGEPQPQFAVNDVLTFEGDSGVTSAVFTVAVEYPSTNTVSVDFATTDGTALDGSDYAGSSGTLVFSPGESNKTVAVTVFGDTVSENDEWFWLVLNNATNALIRRGAAKGTIYNDDCRTSLSAALYTGVTLNGCAGKPYRIEAANINDTNSWFSITNFVLPSSPFTWIDYTASPTQQRYYRAILLAP